MSCQPPLLDQWTTLLLWCMQSVLCLVCGFFVDRHFTFGVGIDMGDSMFSLSKPIK